MGVLVGTALVVIIPEGIEAIYAVSTEVHTHGARSSVPLYRRTIVEAASALPGPEIPPPEFNWKAMRKPVPKHGVRDANGERRSARAEAKAGKVEVDLPVPEFARRPVYKKPGNQKRQQVDNLEDFPTVINDIDPQPAKHRRVEGATPSVDNPVSDLESWPKLVNDIDPQPTDDTVDASVLPTGETIPTNTTTTPSEPTPPTFFIGLSLIAGFILMYLIDALPHLASRTLSSPPPPRQISLHNLSSSSANDDLEDASASDSMLRSLAPSPKQSRSLATTTGLVIHATADGIALGASAGSANTRLGFMVFIAIMLHKAPAAFGLTSVLLKQGLSKRAARGHLIIFSLAAPVGALVTWLILNIAGSDPASDAGQGRDWWTGLLLLFSAGTFLFVAMHAMEEDGAGERERPESVSGMNGWGEVGPRPRKGAGKEVSLRDTLATVVGMCIPLLTQVGHHAHG
jgi:zinc transporter ZupT